MDQSEREDTNGSLLKHGNILRERKPKITPADGRGGLIDVQLPKLN